MPSDHGRAAASSNNRIADLDGIRAIAIWMVMLMHVYYAFPNGPRALSFVRKPLMLILGHGWFGRGLCFLLSGFLITGILLGSKGGARYFPNFYVRRVLRIMPVLLCRHNRVVIFLSRLWADFLLSTAFCANLAPLFHIRHGGGPEPSGRWPSRNIATCCGRS